MPNAPNQKLKIGFVLDDGLDSSDGVQQYVLTLGKEFSDMGHEVHYLVGETKRVDIPNVHSLARNIRVKFNGNRLTIPLPASRPRIKSVLEVHKFDVLHVQMPYSPFFAAKVIRLADKKTAVVGTFHIFPYGFLSKWGTRALGFGLRSTLVRFDSLLSVSKAAQDFAKSSFKIDTVVCPNVVSISKYAPKSAVATRSSSVLKMLYVGRLVDRKGCKQLIEAYIKCVNELPDLKVELTICGKGPQLATLQGLVRDARVEDKVVFKGYVSEENKIAFLQVADIAIFPSYAGESFGIVLIEAMAARAGCVVGGDNPGYRSVLGEIPDSLVEVLDPIKFTSQLKALMTDPKRRRDIYLAQQRIVSQYNSQHVARRLLDIYSIAKNKKTDDNNY